MRGKDEARVIAAALGSRGGKTGKPPPNLGMGEGWEIKQEALSRSSPDLQGNTHREGGMWVLAGRKK